MFHSHDVGDYSNSPNIRRGTDYVTFHHLRSLDHICQRDENLQKIVKSFGLIKENEDNNLGMFLTHVLQGSCS